MATKNSKERLLEVMQRVSGLKPMLNENYPMGAEFDPDAPWNQTDDEENKDTEEFDAYDQYKDDSMDEAYKGINPKYSHFAVLKSDNKIVNGWDYNGYDPEDLKISKKEYFFDDIIDMDINPKLLAIYTKKALEKKGINPFDTNNWYKFEADDWKEKNGLQEDEINKNNPHYQMGELESKYNSLLKDVNKLSEYLNQNPDIEAIKGFVNGMLGNYSV